MEIDYSPCFVAAADIVCEIFKSRKSEKFDFLMLFLDMLKTENFSSDTNIINSSSGIIRTAMTLLMNSQAQVDSHIQR